MATSKFAKNAGRSVKKINSFRTFKEVRFKKVISMRVEAEMIKIDGDGDAGLINLLCCIFYYFYSLLCRNKKYLSHNFIYTCLYTRIYPNYHF